MEPNVSQARGLIRHCVISPYVGRISGEDSGLYVLRVIKANVTPHMFTSFSLSWAAVRHDDAAFLKRKLKFLSSHLMCMQPKDKPAIIVRFLARFHAHTHAV